MTETVSNMVADCAKAQGAIAKVNIKKDAKGNFGKYVTLDAIHEVVLPILADNNLFWTTLPTFDENGEGILIYQLRHTSGEVIEGKMRLLTGQQTPQGQGSALTYAKRYAICAVLGVTADDDDDGHAGSQKPAPMYKKREVTPPVEPFPEEPSRDVNDDAPINETQLKGVVALLTKKEIIGGDTQGKILKRFAKESYGVESIRDITNSQFNDLYTTIQAMDKDGLTNLIDKE